MLLAAAVLADCAYSSPTAAPMTGLRDVQSVDRFVAPHTRHPNAQQRHYNTRPRGRGNHWRHPGTGVRSLFLLVSRFFLVVVVSGPFVIFFWPFFFVPFLPAVSDLLFITWYIFLFKIQDQRSKIPRSPSYYLRYSTFKIWLPILVTASGNYRVRTSS